MPVSVGAETVGKAIVERGKPPTPTPEGKVIADTYKKELKDAGVRSSTERAATRKLEVDSKKAEETIDASIGTAPVDKTTGKKPPRTDAEEVDRFNRATESGEVIATFLEKGKGWENLTPAQKTALRPKIVDKLKEWTGDAHFAGKTPAETEALVDEWMKDPDVFDKVKSLYEARLVNPTSELPGSVAEKQKALADRAKEIGQASKDRVKIKTDLKKEEGDYDRTWAEKDDPANPGGPKIKGSELISLEGFEAQKAVLDADPNYIADRQARVQDLTDRINTLRAREQALATAKNVNQTTLDQATQDLQQAVDDRSGVNKEISDYRTLENNIQKSKQAKTDHEAKIENLKQQRDSFTAKLKELGDQYQKARVEKIGVETSRSEQEEAFVVSVENILADSVDNVITARAKILEDGLQTTLQVEIDGTNDPDRKALLTALQLRYDKFDQSHGILRTGIKKSEIKRVPDKDKIEADLDTLKGADPMAAQIVVERALAGAINPVTNEAYTAVEISNLISSNPEFVKANVGDVVAALIIKGLQTNQIGINDINEMINKKYVTEAKMIEVVTSSQAVKENLEKAGIAGKTLEFLKKNKKLGWWILFAPLLTTPAGVLAVSGYAGYRLIRNAGAKQAAAS